MAAELIFHSITSSARASSVGGTSRPSARGGGQIDDEIELGRLHDRKVGRLGAFEDAAGVDANLPKYFGQARAVAHQAAGFGELAHSIDGGNRMARRQRGELGPPVEEERIGADHECTGFVADKGRERSIDRWAITRPNDLDLHPDSGCRCRHLSRHGLDVRIVGIDQ